MVISNEGCLYLPWRDKGAVSGDSANFFRSRFRDCDCFTTWLYSAFCKRRKLIVRDLELKQNQKSIPMRITYHVYIFYFLISGCTATVGWFRKIKYDFIVLDVSAKDDVVAFFLLQPHVYHVSLLCYKLYILCHIYLKPMTLI